MLDKITPKMKNPTYFYSFGYYGDGPPLIDLFGNNRNLGVGHGNEMIFFFPFAYVLINRTDADFSEKDRGVSRLLVDLWTSFAANG